ncbi:hypothetical protein CLV51_101151 [Chitinophaga niastensis]|uniref:Uncharacterized protein n=1 Tax=Chitinophaga niastensis TaxID=536980 RepID=A0A2P8HRI7_CHINA|nr:hypothetical protein CLV51_101151 [Chitinophaga niastensis]
MMLAISDLVLKKLSVYNTFVLSAKSQYLKAKTSENHG